MDEELKQAIEAMNQAFAEHKSATEETLAELKSKGSSDVLLAEKQARIDAAMDALEQKQQALEKALAKANRPGAGGDGDGIDPAVTKEVKAAFNDYLRTGAKAGLKAALQKAGSTTTGGWGAGIPVDVSRNIEMRLEKESDARNLVTFENRGSTDITDLLDIGGSTVGWRGEGDTVTGTNTPQLVPRTYDGGMIYAMPSTTEESLDDLFFDVEKWLVDGAVEGFGEEESAVIFTGDGNDQPKGFLSETFSALPDATRTFGQLQYVPSGLAAAVANNTVSADALIDLETELHKRYLKNAIYALNKRTLKTIRKLKDGNGNYIYQPAMTDGTPAQINGYRYSLEEDMPVEAADAMAIAFGDFKKAYKIFPIVGLRVNRDDVTSKGNVLFYVRRRLKGGVYDPRAVKFLKCAVA